MKGRGGSLGKNIWAQGMQGSRAMGPKSRRPVPCSRGNVEVEQIAGLGQGFLPDLAGVGSDSSLCEPRDCLLKLQGSPRERSGVTKEKEGRVLQAEGKWP